jgi:hypothetical protein
MSSKFNFSDDPDFPSASELGQMPTERVRWFHHFFQYALLLTIRELMRRGEPIDIIDEWCQE